MSESRSESEAQHSLLMPAEVVCQLVPERPLHVGGKKVGVVPVVPHSVLRKITIRSGNSSRAAPSPEYCP